jgi:ribosomal protein L14E/L6E/L27E
VKSLITLYKRTTILMDTNHGWAMITGGTHKGKEGQIVSHTPKFTKLDIGGSVVRCKQSFVRLMPVVIETPDIVPTENITNMILNQNKEYEMALKADLAQQEQAQQEQAQQEQAQQEQQEQQAQQEQKEPVFDEVSKEEMRRVRLARFG